MTGKQRPVLVKVAKTGQEFTTLRSKSGGDLGSGEQHRGQIEGLKASHLGYGYETFGSGKCDCIILCLQKWKSPQMTEMKELEWRDNLQR